MKDIWAARIWVQIISVDCIALAPGTAFAPQRPATACTRLRNPHGSQLPKNLMLIIEFLQRGFKHISTAYRHPPAGHHIAKFIHGNEMIAR